MKILDWIDGLGCRRGGGRNRRIVEAAAIDQPFGLGQPVRPVASTNNADMGTGGLARPV